MNNPCRLCGSVVGPDITNRPMCYGCGPDNMKPSGACRVGPQIPELSSYDGVYAWMKANGGQWSVVPGCGYCPDHSHIFVTLQDGRVAEGYTLAHAVFLLGGL